MVEHQELEWEIAERNEKFTGSLNRIIELSQNHFSITLIHCNYGGLRQEATRYFKASCTFNVEFLNLERTIDTLHTEMQKQLGGSRPQAMMVSDLDQINDLDRLLSSSNYIREEFRNSFPFPIFLWVNDIVLNKLIQLAPDLESWTTTLRLEAFTDELTQVLEKHTDRIHEKVLDAGAHGFVPSSLVLDPKLHLEVESAFQTLSKSQVSLVASLEARVKFVLGLGAYVNHDMEKAYTNFEQSVKFWQENHRLKHQGCVLYYLGLWWRRNAASEPDKPDQYDQLCEQAESYFRQCITVLEQAQRFDLVAKFINALGEVLQRRKNWVELEAVAQRAIQLHQTYSDPARLAFAYGTLAEAKTENDPTNWVEVLYLARQAIDALNQFEACSPPEGLNAEDVFLHERQNHRGWYSLIAATALKHLSATEEAINQLDQIKKSSNQLSYHLHLKILRLLQELYRDDKEYQKAFQVKRKQYSLQQQYGRRAFVGAGYLKPRKVYEYGQPDFSMVAKSKVTLASEIQASGRDRDVNNLVQRIQSPRYKLLTLYGPSGVGKSSLINAGLVPALENKQSINGKRILTPIPVVRKYNRDRWLKDLTKLLEKLMEKHLDFPLPCLNSPEEVLAALDILREHNFVMILVFDQLEEFFGSDLDRNVLYQFLGKAFTNSSIKIVFSIRTEYLHELLSFSRTISLRAIGGDILSQDFLYYLGNLSVKNAQSLICELSSRTQNLDADFLKTLVNDLASESKEVIPIELQLVCAQLEEEKITTLSRYKKLGGDAQGRIRKLIQSWLRRGIEDCGAENESTAWKVLYHLTHRETIRTIKTKNELMVVSSESNNRRRTEQIKCILEVLEGSGIILKLREDSKNYYQLVHDYLIPYIQDEYTKHFDEVGQMVRQHKEMLNKDELISRLNTVIQLGEMGTSQAVKPLKQLLEKKESEVSLRWHAFKALSQIQDDEALETLVRKGLEDPEPAIQAHTAHLLGQLNYIPAKERLLAKCEDGNRSVRVQARWAVKRLGVEPPTIEEKNQPLLAYILIKGSTIVSDLDAYSRIEHLKSLQLRDTCGVVECGVTHGNYDFLVKVLVENIESLNEIVMGMIPHLNYIRLTRTFVVVSEPRLYCWQRASVSDARSDISYVWIETIGLNSDSLVSSLMDISEVSEAATVYGSSDVIAKIEAENSTVRDMILTQKIARLPFVASTVTYPIINDDRSYWDNSQNCKFPDEWLIA
jgi:DNA-binding Lrp family transcriptional regulator